MEPNYLDIIYIKITVVNASETAFNQGAAGEKLFYKMQEMDTISISEKKSRI